MLNATGVTGDRRAQIDRNTYNKEMTILIIFYYYPELGKMVLKMYLKCKMQHSFAKPI